jgi:hypothetical protein
MEYQMLNQLFFRFPWMISGCWFALFSSIASFFALPLLAKHGYIYQASIFLLGTGIFGVIFGSLLRDLVFESRHRPVGKEIVMAGGLIFSFSLGLTAFSFSILYYKGLELGLDILIVVSAAGWAVLVLLSLGWIVAPLGGIASYSLSKICNLQTISSEILSSSGQPKSGHSSNFVNNTKQRFIEKEYQLYIFMNVLSLTGILSFITLFVFDKARIEWSLSILIYLINISALLIFPIVPLILFFSYLCRHPERPAGKRRSVIKKSQIVLILTWVLICFYLGFMAVFSISGPG